MTTQREDFFPKLSLIVLGAGGCESAGAGVSLLRFFDGAGDLPFAIVLTGDAALEVAVLVAACSPLVLVGGAGVTLSWRAFFEVRDDAEPDEVGRVVVFVVGWGGCISNGVLIDGERESFRGPKPYGAADRPFDWKPA